MLTDDDEGHVEEFGCIFQEFSTIIPSGLELFILPCKDSLEDEFT